MGTIVKTIVLPIYYEQKFKTKKSKTFLVGLNWYRNAHHSISNKVKHDYHELVMKQCVSEEFHGKIKLHYRVYVARKNTDGSNIRSVIEKFLLDGLVEGGHINNDTIEYVVGDTSNYYQDKENPRMEIDIETVDN